MVPGPGRGPLVICGRPHSGTRLVAGLLRAGGVFLGADLTDPQLDAWSVHQQLVVPLVRHRLTQAEPAEALHVGRAGLAAAWPRYAGGGLPAEVWGWKVCEASFVLPELRTLLPDAVFLHVLRDGRDVIRHGNGYFQITAPGSDPPGWRTGMSYREFAHLVTFGRIGLRRWQGIDLDDPRALVRHRHQLQMQAWVIAVREARDAGARLGGRYHELRFEDLCAAPDETARALFGRLDLEWSEPAARFLQQVLVAGEAGRWRRERLSGQDARDFARAVALGRDVLEECGYRA
jgi:hypothetical protein